MSLGIYKQGQGYWVRVLTAALIAVVTLGAAGWMAGQTERFEAQLPRNAWRMIVQNPRGEAAPGQPVILLGAADRGAEPEKIGDAVVKSFTSGQELVIGSVTMVREDADPSLATAVASAPGAAATFSARVRDPASGIAPIERTLLVGLVVGLVLLLGSCIAYYFTAVRPGSVDFLISTDMEMKKVHWSSAKEIRGSTIVVIGACVLIAAFLFGIDFIFQAFFRWIGILVGTD